MCLIGTGAFFRPGDQSQLLFASVEPSSHISQSHRVKYFWLLHSVCISVKLRASYRLILTARFVKHLQLWEVNFFHHIKSIIIIDIISQRLWFLIYIKKWHKPQPANGEMDIRTKADKMFRVLEVMWRSTKALLRCHCKLS